MILNVPEIWALPAAEFKLYAALLTFCRSDGSGAFPTNETLAEMVGVNERSIRRLLSELESKGVIDKTTEERANGSFKRTITVNYVPVIRAGHASVSKTWESNQNGEDMDNLPHVTDNRGGRLSGTGGGRLLATTEHTHKEHSHFNNDDDEERKTPSAEKRADAEPFEMTVSGSLPKVASLPFRQVAVSRSFEPVKVPPEMRDRIYTSLGIDGDEFARHLTQAMIDRDGFVDDVLRNAEKGKKRIALALSLLKQFGNWLSPEEKREADKKLREDVFWRKMGVQR
jgi:hypothetical protein